MDLYAKKINNNAVGKKGLKLKIIIEDSNKEEQLYAVKTFKLDGGGTKHLKCVRREVECLREMAFCENVITLEAVYRGED